MDVKISSSSALSAGLASTELSKPVVRTNPFKGAEADKATGQPVVGSGGASLGAVEQAVSDIQDFMQSIQRDLNFAVDDSSGGIIVKVTDGASGEVIRQIPSEEALRLAESLEHMRSLLFKTQA